MPQCYNDSHSLSHSSLNCGKLLHNKTVLIILQGRKSDTAKASYNVTVYYLYHGSQFKNVGGLRFEIKRTFVFADCITS